MVTRICYFSTKEKLTNSFFFERMDLSRVEVLIMYQERIILTSKDILEKDFKVDTRGYRPQEVDKYLDIIIKDIEEYNDIIKELRDEKNELIDDNMKLKQEIRRLRTKLDAIKDYPPGEVHNADLLRRLSNLEKIIYGEKE